MKTKNPSRRVAGKKTSRSRRKAIAIKRILVPLDGSEHAVKALHYAIQFAQCYGARIDTVRIVEPTVYPDGSTIPQHRYNQDEVALKMAQTQSKKIAGKLIPEGVTWRNHVLKGNPYAEIVGLAAKQKTDLLLITTHGHTGLQRFLLGSAAEKIIRHAPCPVMVVRDEEHDFA
jgi:universal stress protein A